MLSAGSTENIDTSRVGPHSFRATLCVALQWRTALGASLVTATGIMFLSSLYLSLMRSAARMLPKSDYMWLAGFSTDAVAIASPLRKAVGIVLSFYALDRVAWYWRILMLGYMIHGRTCDLGMIGGGIKKASETEWRKAHGLQCPGALAATSSVSAPEVRGLSCSLGRCAMQGHSEAVSTPVRFATSGCPALPAQTLPGAGERSLDEILRVVNATCKMCVCVCALTCLP